MYKRRELLKTCEFDLEQRTKKLLLTVWDSMEISQAMQEEKERIETEAKNKKK